jgi:hypothetical protein
MGRSVRLLDTGAAFILVSNGGRLRKHEKDSYIYDKFRHLHGRIPGKDAFLPLWQLSIIL